MAVLLFSFVNEFNMKKEIEIKNQELETIMEKTGDAMICISNDGK